MASQKNSICVVLLVLSSPAVANEFLKFQPKEVHEALSEDDIRTSLLEEIEGTLGTGAATKRLAELEASLKPIYAALPKNEHGNLGHSTVRYALHRLFVLRHGWNIKGLGANGGKWNASSPTGVLTDQVPSYIEEMFENRLEGKGLGLHELAIFAATIEHLIHREVVGKLGDAFNVMEILPTSNLSETEGFQVLDAYMMAYILGENLGNLTKLDAVELISEMPELFLTWHETQKFVLNIHERLAENHVTSAPLDFSRLASIVEAVGEEFGTFQDVECKSLKKSLMELESNSIGRVKLADFYKPALDGSWQFQESVDYLRQLGALDETESEEPRVIITNYLYSQTNCIASSGFYSVCCKDECEGLLGHLEEKLAASEATPAEITALVMDLPSSTVSAPRVLQPILVSRLDHIALHHGGAVPLHGRLFAQWMHHAYPRECPYPHLSGTTSQQTSDEWLSESGTEATATKEEMAQYSNATVKKRSTSLGESKDVALPWSYEEELLVVRSPSQSITNGKPMPPRMRSLVLLVAAGSLAVGLVQSFKTSLSKSDDYAKVVV
mmetsp:Transcript_97908/g.154268  ORF Transcript_97908/g.154268 Transcript_97908/m.154268 type:complete len:556 (-) Transcript_97908:195-1862(-)